MGLLLCVCADLECASHSPSARPIVGTKKKMLVQESHCREIQWILMEGSVIILISLFSLYVARMLSLFGFRFDVVVGES